MSGSCEYAEYNNKCYYMAPPIQNCINNRQDQYTCPYFDRKKDIAYNYRKKVNAIKNIKLQSFFGGRNYENV
jgi:hypothetical protein